MNKTEPVDKESLMPSQEKHDSTTKRWKVFGLLMTPLLVSSCGLYLLLQGYGCATLEGMFIEKSIWPEPDFERQTKMSLIDENVSVAVVCSAPANLKSVYTEVDYQLMKFVSNRLFNHSVEVANSDEINEWLKEHPDWKNPEEIGTAFRKTHVIHIDLQEFSLFENGNQNLFRGRAKAQVTVTETQANGTGKKIYSKSISTLFPADQPRTTEFIDLTKFRRYFMEELSEDIGLLFYIHYSGEGIPHDT